jgi:hypothetical protein
MFRASFAVLICLGTTVPVAAQVSRISVSTAGVEANQWSGAPAMSADGRFVVFYSFASNLVDGDTNGKPDVFLRDRDTDADGVFDEAGAVATTRLNLGPGGVQTNSALSLSPRPAITPDGRFVTFGSAAQDLLPGGEPLRNDLYRLDRQTSTLIRLAAGVGDYAISADGDVVALAGVQGLDVIEIAAGRRTTLSPPEVPNPGLLPVQVLYTDINISADGRWVSAVRVRAVTFRVEPTDVVGVVFDRVTGTRVELALGQMPRLVRLSASGSSVVVQGRDGTVWRRAIASGSETRRLTIGFSTLLAVSPSARYGLLDDGRLADVDLAMTTPLGFVPGNTVFSNDDRWLAVSSATDTLVAGDTNGVNDVFVIDLPDLLDADDDTMDDRWETLFGVTDPAADPDGDGQTNAQEEDAGTHPNGQVRRFLAEGATGTFFHTAISLANPSLSPAAALLTFDRGDGTRVRLPVALAAGRSVAVDAGAVTGVEAADISTTLESDRLVAVHRSMTWGSPAGAIYGSHGETATPSPSATWFLTEGSTVQGFDLFYLLQNPQSTVTHTTVRFLLPSGTTITRTYDLAPASRTTIYVNQIDGLGETDVSGGITADAPIVVERSMYRSLPGQPFALGTDSIGVPAAATSWFLAEGATGTFFDLYVLIANPGNADATVLAQYAKPDGSIVTQSYAVRAHSRFSVYVDALAGLENTSVATTLTSTNGVPIVAERAMYWPGGFFDYYEGHTSAGSTATALEWVVSGGQNGGADAAQTFVLIANTLNQIGEATVAVLPDSSFAGAVPGPVTVALPPNSRTTVPVTSLTGSFGVRITSSGASPVPLVVESAIYRSAGGVLWSAGSNSLATPVVP